MSPLPDELFLGHPLLDAQHREFYEAAEKFAECAGKADAEQLRKFVWFIHDYAIDHFHLEEELMQQHRYPNMWAHQDEHQAFWRSLLETIEACEVDGYGGTCGKAFFENAMNWLQKHILGSDLELAKWLKAKGVIPVVEET